MNTYKTKENNFIKLLNGLKNGKKYTHEVCDEIMYNYTHTRDDNILMLFYTDSINLFGIGTKSKTFYFPKKEITIKWFNERVNMYNVYASQDSKHYLNLAKIISSKLEIGNRFYVASYGVGIDNFYTEKEKERINAFFIENGIKFTRETSRANYITRFKISKEKNNIKHLLKIINGLSK